jgi:hypothetical protein
MEAERGLTELAYAVALAEVGARGLEPPAAQPASVQEEEVYLGDWVLVARYLSYEEVHILQSRLEGAGIPAAVADAQLIQTDALLTAALRGASLRVPAACAQEALEIIDALKRGDFRLDDNFEPTSE